MVAGADSNKSGARGTDDHESPIRPPAGPIVRPEIFSSGGRILILRRDVPILQPARGTGGGGVPRVRQLVPIVRPEEFISDVSVPRIPLANPEGGQQRGPTAVKV